MAAMEAANAHYHNGHHQQSGPPLPASPTLTNPDMILPDYDRSDSPDPDLNRSSHPALMAWNNAHIAASASDAHHMFIATGLAGQHPYGPAGAITPTTPIIYGNGTMLSDIGEVTEVESTVGKPSPGRTKSGARRPESPKRAGGGETELRSSPTMGAAMIKKKSKQSLKTKRERRSSMESNSTITTEDQAGAFADFDDSVSVGGDSVFQGDDEESMASSYVEGTAAIEPASLGVTKSENLDRLSSYSTTSLSRRAEEILANAKRRLTTMEGNLNRARSSLHYTSPYGSDGSTPSPPFQRAATAMSPRDNALDPGTPPTNHTPGHTRMLSDIAMRNGLPYRVSLPRSQSALGVAGGYRQPLTSSKSADYIRGDTADEPHRQVHRASSVREAGLKPLTEDEVARLGDADSASQNARLEAFLSPTFGSFNGDGGLRTIQRSSSAAQMRDIKDQMRDLKGKISSLREQARADSMKRRSLQSLRTPSPFTHSQIDQWYAEPRSNRTSEIMTSSLPGRNPWNGEESSVDGDVKDGVQQPNELAQEERTEYAEDNGIQPEHVVNGSLDAENLSTSRPVIEADNEVEEDAPDTFAENSGMDEDGEEDFHDAHDAHDADYMSESGESLYHDTVQHQISHEDREDAFDYERFFLHSALGTMSLTRRASAESLTSEDSVETARGPVANGTNSGEDGLDRPRAWGRRDSSNSISTIDTFATAQEARSLRSPVSLEEVHQGLNGAYESSSRATSAQSHRYRSGSTATAKRLSFNPGSARPSTSAAATRDSDGFISPIAEEGSSSPYPAIGNSQALPQPHLARRGSVIHRPISVAATSSSLHRPSISSFDSVGTNRSFPLVNKPNSDPKRASSTGVLTPRDSPNRYGDRDLDLGSITSRLMNELHQNHSHHHEHHHDNNNQSQTNGESAGGRDGDNKTAAAGGGIGVDTMAGGPHLLEGLLREDRYLVERVVASLGRCVLGLTENGRASAESRMHRRRIDAARRALEGQGAFDGPGTE